MMHILERSKAFLSVAQHLNPSLGRVIIKFPTSRTIRHTHTHTHTHTHIRAVGLLSTSDQLVVEAATYTTHNKDKRRTPVPSSGLEPTIPAVERPQTYTLDGSARNKLVIQNFDFFLSPLSSSRSAYRTLGLFIVWALGICGSIS
jgi:hypothetical protein